MDQFRETVTQLIQQTRDKQEQLTNMNIAYNEAKAAQESQNTPSVPPQTSQDEQPSQPEIKTEIITIPEQAQRIQRTFSRIQPELQTQIHRKNVCCANDSPCCQSGLYHHSGRSFKTIVRRLSRRTRKLIRDIEHRGENRRNHSRTRRALRRMFARFENTLEILN